MNKIIGYTTQKSNRSATILSGLELAKQDLHNHFNIRKGEKWTNPDFGSDLPLYVFQPLDETTIQLIEEDVYNVVSYDPRFDLIDRNVRVSEDEHSITVRIQLLYLPTTTETALQLKFDKEFDR